MPAQLSGPPLHGGVARVLTLAVRTLRRRSGVVALADGASVRLITGVGEDRELLLDAAARCVAGEPAPAGVLAAPLCDGPSVVGAVCLAGGDPLGAPDEEADLPAALHDIAAVLSDQLDLIRRLGPPPDPAAVARLERALDAGHLRAWFQPILTLDGEGLVGFEALARWRDDAGDEVARPGDFVPLAEQAGLVDRLDHAVIRDAVTHLARWQRTRPELRLSVNLSGRHLDADDWLDEVHGTVVAAGVDPSTIELELTESVRPADVVRCAAELRRARDLGYEIWLDDFGTGWSELRQLVELPVDGVKVDRFFTEALGGTGDAIVRAVVGLAGDLGLDTVIEGVSEPEHAERARALGCRLAQGFLWSPAVSPEAAEGLVATAGRPLDRVAG